MSTPSKPRPRCPICKAPASPDHLPFCSQLCKDRDLLKWMNEDYRAPVAPEEEPPRD
ncbi:DNA gyrase inhibitor YacG [Pacificimonas flava]|uniref:DNA gyrase inhibitor YacG n=2 Tax=Pacificimonas TaxID=1960290 RepID=A0A219B4E1_9SPHN|nr:MULTISPECIES: DNA gyrase inhibitor YacG [Pacificimonas]MBZ6377671.1 DNA gyrase inhibitor YacG [Pacificimonas aurantium]OWV32648.1 DNA gyrase inhibitor YacG [Pacificimonas flava]